MVVTPWEVKGKVDYERLIREFGTQPLTDELLQQNSKYTRASLHLQIEGTYFFSHRDLDTVLNLYEQGTKFVLYTGRGPRDLCTSGILFLGFLRVIFKRNLTSAYTSK